MYNSNVGYTTAKMALAESKAGVGEAAEEKLLAEFNSSIAGRHGGRVLSWPRGG